MGNARKIKFNRCNGCTRPCYTKCLDNTGSFKPRHKVGIILSSELLTTEVEVLPTICMKCRKGFEGILSRRARMLVRFDEVEHINSDGKIEVRQVPKYRVGRVCPSCVHDVDMLLPDNFNTVRDDLRSVREGNEALAEHSLLGMGNNGFHGDNDPLNDRVLGKKKPHFERYGSPLPGERIKG